MTQNTGNPTFCSNPITLTAHSTCILQLDITQPVQSGFAICKGTTCTAAAAPLNVRKGTSLLGLIVSAGQYYSQLPVFVSNNGQAWELS